MKFVCNRCQTILSIPDEALRGENSGGFKCVLCHGTMAAEPSPVLPDDALTPLQMITAGGKKLLIAITDRAVAERVGRAMSELDWHIVHAPTPSSALSHIEDIQYDLVILQERNAAPNQPDDPVVRYVHQLPMPLRRTFLLCLLSERTPTLDSMAAFRAGADLIVNLQDVEKLQSILDHMLKQHQAAYAKFTDELRRKGTSRV